MPDLVKPAFLYDRDAEWRGLSSFVSDARPGRLRRARDLLTVKGFDTRDTVLACYSGAGFHPHLAAGKPDNVRLIGLSQLYGGD